MAKAVPINTTRRTALSACLAAAVPMIATAPASSGNPSDALGPTSLGLELIRRLPAYAAASRERCQTVDREWNRADDTGEFTRNPEFDAYKLAVADERFDDAHKRIEEIVKEIHRCVARAPIKHLVDMAIVLSLCSDYPLEEVDETALQEIGVLGDDGASLLSQSLALGLLKLAQIPPSDCSVNSLYQSLER